ncbi:MAG: DUF559 domain-containing protein [Burkholderiales bacterium]|nr:DUF559 domain-containing protein [Burkholderiales bacterium]
MSHCRAYLRGMLPGRHVPVARGAKAPAPRRRAQAAKAEVILWQRLQRGRLHGRRFRRRHSVGPYVLDFYCPEERLAVELDRAERERGRAERRAAFRTAYLAATGVRVVRFGDRDVVRNLEGVLAAIGRCLVRAAGRVHALGDDE